MIMSRQCGMSFRRPVENVDIAHKEKGRLCQVLSVNTQAPVPVKVHDDEHSLQRLLDGLDLGVGKRNTPGDFTTTLANTFGSGETGAMFFTPMTALQIEFLANSVSKLYVAKKRLTAFKIEKVKDDITLLPAAKDARVKNLNKQATELEYEETVFHEIMKIYETLVRDNSKYFTGDGMWKWLVNVPPTMAGSNVGDHIDYALKEMLQILKKERTNAINKYEKYDRSWYDWGRTEIVSLLDNWTSPKDKKKYPIPYVMNAVRTLFHFTTYTERVGSSIERQIMVPGARFRLNPGFLTRSWRPLNLGTRLWSTVVFIPVDSTTTSKVYSDDLSNPEEVKIHFQEESSEFGYASEINTRMANPHVLLFYGSTFMGYYYVVAYEETEENRYSSKYRATLCRLSSHPDESQHLIMQTEFSGLSMRV